jgi:hypothetical protein
VRHLDLDIENLEGLQKCQFSWLIERDYDDVFTVDAITTHRGDCTVEGGLITVTSPVRVAKFFLLFEESAFTKHSATSLKYLVEASEADGDQYLSQATVSRCRNAPVFERIQVLSLRGVIPAVSIKVHWLGACFRKCCRVTHNSLNL